MLFAVVATFFLLSGVAVGASPSGTTTPTKGPRPNIVLILADDLDFDYKQDRLAFSPNLRRLREAGVHLENHVAAIPVCGPSRSSLLAGRFSHNTGYIMNDGNTSIAAWTKAENNTVGTWLSAAGYYTMYLGKYINSMESHVPAGWSRWHGFSSGGGTYNYNNASMYDVPNTTTAQRPFPVKVMTGVHQADFLGEYALQGVAEAAAQGGKPFYIQINPVMVHWGTCYGPGSYAPRDPHWEWAVPCPPGNPDCCPTSPAAGRPGVCVVPISPCPSTATAHAFDGATNPHVPSYNTSETGPVPEFMGKFKALTAWEEARQDLGFRNRSASALDLDRMLGVVLDGLEAAGVASNTFVLFTSDNGYHLGEHRMLFGKGEPYDTDIRLPFYAMGPGVPPNTTQAHPTTHVDIAATVMELTGALPLGEDPLDGLSFAPVLGPTPPPPLAWRNHSFSEFFGSINTWAALRYPLLGAAASAAAGGGGEGGVVQAAKVTQWCTNDTEVFDLGSDPWELHNIAAQPSGAQLLEGALPLLAALSKCKGGLCRHPVPSGPHPLVCRNDVTAEGVVVWDV